MHAGKILMWTSLVLVVSLLVPLNARATSYTWTGDTSATKSWDAPANWGSSAFPNAYTDTATLTTTTDWPATIGIGTTNTIQLGTSTTTGSGGTTVALDIASGGTLGLKGNIANTRRIQIDANGILSNNDSATHTISGTGGNILLDGGTLSSAGGGVWTLSQAVNGYGTISAPFTNTGGISANSSGNTLVITGNSTSGGSLTATGGGILSLQSTITGGTISTGNSGGVVDLNGASLTGVTFTSPGSGTVNLTGNSTFAGTIGLNNYLTYTLGGANGAHTLNLNGASVSNFGSGPALFSISTGGVLNNFGSAASSIGSSDPVTLAGGSVTSTGAGTFTVNDPITGYGTVSGPLVAFGGITAKGGQLTVDGTGGAVTSTSGGFGTDGLSGSILDLKGSISVPNMTPGTNGVIQLDGASLNGSINNSGSAGGGTVKVVNTSTVNGTYWTGAALAINTGQLNIASSGTLGVSTGGSLSDLTTLAIGHSTLTSVTTSSYNLGGGGNITLAGGSVTTTGSGVGFTSTDPLSGWGNVTAPLINNSTVTALGNGSPQTLNLSNSATATVANTGNNGWFAHSGGTLVLPTISVGGTSTYTWGAAAENLVNSLTPNVTGVSGTGTDSLTISLLSPDPADVAPGLSNVIGVWNFAQSGTLSIASADLTFRYDHALAQSLSVNESTLGLYRLDGSTWDLVGSNSPDTTNYLLTANGVTTFGEFAIATVVPEPSTLVLLATGAMGLAFGWWRKRRALA